MKIWREGCGWGLRFGRLDGDGGDGRGDSLTEFGRGNGYMFSSHGGNGNGWGYGCALSGRGWQGHHPSTHFTPNVLLVEVT